MATTFDTVQQQQAIRDRISQLLGALSESELSTVQKFIEFVYHGAGIHTVATAPLDDEPESEQERREVQEVRDSLARGEQRKPDQDLRRELGFG